MANFCSECGKQIAQNVNFCSSCGAPLTGKEPAKAQWQDKRDRVLGQQQIRGKSRTRLFIWVAGIALLGGWVYLNLPEGGNLVIKASPVVVNAVDYGETARQMVNVSTKVENGKIIIPLDLLKEKKFVKFLYDDAAGGLPMLAYISSEGKIITAVSMCEPCNSTQFHIRGDELICNSCGTKWRVDDLEAISGSCGRFPPDPLPNAIVGNEIRIGEQFAANWKPRK